MEVGFGGERVLLNWPRAKAKMTAGGHWNSKREDRNNINIRPRQF